VPVAGRRLLLAILLYRRQHGRSPLWSELRNALKLGYYEVPELVWELRRNGLVTFTKKTRSIRVTPAGLRAALRKRGPR
jgi:Mn-dependent DtxR family transcriptional regulator